jgi:Tol biopolymer transport system component
MRLVLLALCLAPLGLKAQSPGPQQVRLIDVLPAGIRTTQIALTSDAKRVYYGDSARAIWFYDRNDKRNVRLVEGQVFDLAISPLGDALAYTRTVASTAEHHIWVLPLDARTGLAAGRERRVGTRQGDAPTISADGKWLAFAADDSTGVGQGVAIVPIGGGRERMVLPSLRTGVNNVRWAPDGRSLFLGVNPPVPCNPDWSCLALKDEFKHPTTGSLRRISVSDGSSRVIAPKVGAGWPGLATDGSVLAYTDTGFPTRVVVADTNGRTLHSFPLPQRQTMEGWVGSATLVFSDRGDVRRLRSYSLADDKSRLLADSLDQLTEPVWSPDGALIAAASCVPARCDLRLGRFDGSVIKMIPLPDRYGGGNAWSPDQRWVAYVGGPPNGERHVNVIDVATGQVQQLSTVRSPTVSIVWSADSRALIVSSTVGGTGAGRHATIERVEIGSQPRALREVALGASPSGGNAISSTTAVFYRGGELKRVGLEGDSSETVLIPKQTVRYSGFFTTAPDQKRLAFRRTRDGDVDGDLSIIEVMNADGSGRVTIEVPFAMLNGPASLRFLPGGTQLIATALPSSKERNIGVYVVGVDTKTVKKLFTIPIMSFTNELAVSPDGRTILYVANETMTPRVFTMDLSSLRADARK